MTANGAKDDVPAPARALHRYALQEPRLTARLDRGFVNDSFTVEDAAGRRYLLRGHPRIRDRARLQLQLDLQQHVGQRGVPVPPIIASPTGEGMVFVDGVLWVLFAYVEGSDYDFTNVEQTRAAAQALARFHLAGRSFHPSVAPSPEVGQSSFWYDRFRTAPEQPRLLAELFPEPELSEPLDFSCEWWASFSREWTPRRTEALVHTWVHSDFHGRNVAFEGNRVRGIFDFDDIWFGPRICDVGLGVFNFGRETRGIATPEGRRMRRDYALAFLESYEAEFPLSEEERLAVPAMVKAVFPPNAFQLRWMKQHGLDFRRRFLRDVEITRQMEHEVGGMGDLNS